MNLSNGVSFGLKERGMAELNDFIESNDAKMRDLLRRLSEVGDEGDGGGDVPTPAVSGNGTPALGGAADRIATAVAAEAVDIPRRVIEEAVASLYVFVEANLEAIMAGLRDSEDPKMRQFGMLLGGAMQQLRAEPALAGLREGGSGGSGGHDLAGIFASFGRGRGRSGGRDDGPRDTMRSVDFDRLRLAAGAGAGSEISYELASVASSGGGGRLATLDDPGNDGGGEGGDGFDNSYSVGIPMGSMGNGSGSGSSTSGESAGGVGT